MATLKLSKFNLKRTQWLVWSCVFIITFLSFLPTGVWYQSLCYTLINTCYYASIIYGNISILYPRFYETSKNITYGISVFLMLVVCGLVRTFFMALAYNAFTPHPEKRRVGA